MVVVADVVDVTFNSIVELMTVGSVVEDDTVVVVVVGLVVVVVMETIVVVGTTDVFCRPSVFQMDGPTELNQGGLGLAVDDVGVAKIKIKISNYYI